MVKHGRNKKRRAGRIGKTKLKNRSWNRWDPKPRFTNAVVKKNWDVSKSPAENLRNMGLLAYPNQLASQRQPQEEESGTGNSTMIELFDIPESDEQQDLSRKHPMNKIEEEYVARCMSKYGDDYARMFRDTKVNNMQHTENKLRKLGARYLLLAPEQRRIPVPENVKDLLPDAT